MFAFLLQEKMFPFYKNISSMPTAFFTVMLVLSFLYWLSAILGMVDMDSLDFDLPDGADAGNISSTAGGLAGLMVKFGLNGIPLVITFSLISLFGWLISFYIIYYFSNIVPDGFIRWLISIPLIVFILILSSIITGFLLKPFRPLFEMREENTVKNILGQTAIVRSKNVDQQFGEVFLNDGGAGLILKVRSRNNEKFKRQDRVVLLEYREAENFYFVISEKEFLDI